MSPIPTPPALKEALRNAIELERRAKEINTAVMWQACAECWKAVANLARGC